MHAYFPNPQNVLHALTDFKRTHSIKTDPKIQILSHLQTVLYLRSYAVPADILIFFVHIYKFFLINCNNFNYCTQRDYGLILFLNVIVFIDGESMHLCYNISVHYIENNAWKCGNIRNLFRMLTRISHE